MPQYITYSEFLSSPYGAEFQPGESIFNNSLEIDSFLQFISGLIDVYTSRTFEETSHEQEFEDKSSKHLFLNQIPVVSIDSIECIERVNATPVEIDPSLYDVNEKTGKVKFLSNLDPDCTYVVNYTAGYSTIPDPIKQATLMLANTYAQAIDTGSVGIADGGAVTSSKFAKFAEQYSDPRQKNPQFDQGIPVTVEAILRKYRYLK